MGLAVLFVFWLIQLVPRLQLYVVAWIVFYAYWLADFTLRWIFGDAALCMDYHAGAIRCPPDIYWSYALILLVELALVIWAFGFVTLLAWNTARRVFLARAKPG